jgi:hypothetical protein
MVSDAAVWASAVVLVLVAVWAYGACCGLGAAILAALWVWGWR